MFKSLEQSKFPIEKGVNTFLDTSVSNTYQSYRDLFPSADVSYIPTGTCVPFDRKIFLTVNGKILPCEKVGQEMPLGYVENGKVDIDFEYVADLYGEEFRNLVKKCHSCLLWKNCSLCLYYIPKINGVRQCNSYMPKDTFIASYQSRYLSILEDNTCNFTRAYIDISKD